MAALHEVRVTVTGNGPFPLDMLRYDGLHPERSEDTTLILGTLTSGDGAVDIQLLRWAPRGWRPTEGRWRSYRWFIRTVEPIGREP